MSNLEPNPELTYFMNGTAILVSKYYQNLTIIFDESAVELLKGIVIKNNYYFTIFVNDSEKVSPEERWEFTPVPKGNSSETYSNSLSGSIIKNDKKQIVCTYP
ncbi:hypothetical protein QUB05_27730 [Microcoleus sp. F10-C6]|jgi:hypothetical protein|uniref:hypothetical protein n=1 Tax=unclassified Microcoleus TaxID=2642155 RepID=UPI002FD2D114